VIPAAHQRLTKNHRFVAGDLNPPILTVVGGVQPECSESLGRPVYELLFSEFLKETPELSLRRIPLLEIHEVDLDSALLEEAFRLAHVGVVLDAENLDIHADEDSVLIVDRGSASPPDMDLQLGLFPDDTPVATGAPVGPAPVPDSLRRVAEGLSRSVRLGTSSWSFPGWDGLVYDRAASQNRLARHGLGAYAMHPLLRTVGLDRTYYRSIDEETYRRYAEAVPRDFRFLVKADRLLTSPTDPDRFGARGVNPHFLDPRRAVEEVLTPMLEGLTSKVGPILFQFPPIPPNLIGGVRRFHDRLYRFLDALPDGPTYAVELRTPEFLNDEYATLLQATGAAHCYTVHPAMAPLEKQKEVVSPFYQPTLVIRWMLRAGLKYQVAKERYQPFDRIVDEDPTSRDAIARTVLDALIAERQVFVIANNKAEGSAPLSLFRLAERVTHWTTDAP